MKLEDWWFLILLGFVRGLGHFTLIKAYRNLAVATVFPFTYRNLLWAKAFGYLTFDDLPDQWTVNSTNAIIASGLYVFQREQERKDKNMN